MWEEFGIVNFMESLIVGGWSATPEVVNTTTAKDPDPWLVEWATGGSSDAGIAVNAETALSHTPIWHGLLLLGGDAGSLVMQLKRRTPDGNKINDTTHPAYKLTSVRPNAVMCPNTFYELILATAILYGNFVGEILRTSAGGRPLPVQDGGGIVPLNPRTTKPSHDDSGKLWISTRDLIDGRLQPERFIDPADTLHISNLSTNGFWGRAITAVGKNRIANGLGYLSHSNHVFANATKSDFLFAFPGNVQQTAIDHFREELDKTNAGLHNRGKPIIVGGGMVATQLGMNLEDAQLVELVQLDITQCASLLGIPAIMLNAMQAMTFSNTEESERWYINRTLRRWLNKIAEECLAKLFTPREQEQFVFEWDMDPLLKGRLAERYTAYSQAIASRWLNPNEVRALEGYNPRDDDSGDEYENPNTSSVTINGGSSPPPAQNAVESQPAVLPDQKELAVKLTKLLTIEDRAGRKEAVRGDFVQWLKEYYDLNFRLELKTLVPKTANEYCDDRHLWWLNVSGVVASKTQLQDLIKAQSVTVGDRVAGLITREMVQ